MYTFYMSYNRGADDITKALKHYFPRDDVDILHINDGNFIGDSSIDPDSYTDASEYYKNPVSKDIRSLVSLYFKNLHELKIMNENFEKIQKNYCLLRQKYEEKSKSLSQYIWNSAKYDPDLQAIPDVIDNEQFVESDSIVGRFEILSMLGEGKFGSVKLCRHLDTKSEFAMKIIPKKNVGSYLALKRVAKEIEMLRSVYSPYVASLETTLLTKKNLYIIMEKGGPDLHSFLVMYPNGVSEDMALDIMKNSVLAIHACHVRNICHRDIKPENILIDIDFNNKRVLGLKLCDFGVSTESCTDLTDLCGSQGFMAPEMVLNKSYSGEKADIWSLGCVLLNVVLGNYAFGDYWVASYHQANFEYKQKFSSAVCLAIEGVQSIVSSSHSMKNVISQCLTFDPVKRPSIYELQLPHSYSITDLMFADSASRDLEIDVFPESDLYLRSINSSSIVSPSRSPDHQVDDGANTDDVKRRKRTNSFFLPPLNFSYTPDQTARMRLPFVNPPAKVPFILTARKLSDAHKLSANIPCTPCSSPDISVLRKRQNELSINIIRDTINRLSDRI